MAKTANELFKSQESDQNQMIDLRFGFTAQELFSKEAQSIPNFLLGGFSLHSQFNQWEGVH
jgi:hypothetical protein